MSELLRYLRRTGRVSPDTPDDPRRPVAVPGGLWIAGDPWVLSFEGDEWADRRATECTECGIVNGQAVCSDCRGREGEGIYQRTCSECCCCFKTNRKNAACCSPRCSDRWSRRTAG